MIVNTYTTITRDEKVGRKEVDPKAYINAINRTLVHPYDDNEDSWLNNVYDRLRESGVGIYRDEFTTPEGRKADSVTCFKLNTDKHKLEVHEEIRYKTRDYGIESLAFEIPVEYNIKEAKFALLDIPWYINPQELKS